MIHCHKCFSKYLIFSPFLLTILLAASTFTLFITNHVFARAHSSVLTGDRPVTIEFSMSESGYASLKIFDILGREVATLVNEDLKAGVYNVSWDAKNYNGIKVVSGTYFYKLSKSNRDLVRKMLIVR